MDDETSNVGQQDGALTRVMSWAAHPFSSDMDALDWFLWFGLIAFSALLWHLLIDRFTGD